MPTPSHAKASVAIAPPAPQDAEQRQAGGDSKSDQVTIDNCPSADYHTIVAPVFISPNILCETFSAQCITATADIDKGEILIVEHAYCETADDASSDWLPGMMCAIAGDPCLYNALRPRKRIQPEASGPSGEKVPASELWAPEWVSVQGQDAVVFEHLKEKIVKNCELSSTRSVNVAILAKLVNLAEVVEEDSTQADTAGVTNVYRRGFTIADLDELTPKSSKTGSAKGTPNCFQDLTALARKLEKSLPGLVSDLRFHTLIATRKIKAGEALLLPATNHPEKSGASAFVQQRLDRYDDISARGLRVNEEMTRAGVLGFAGAGGLLYKDDADKNTQNEKKSTSGMDHVQGEVSKICAALELRASEDFGVRNFVASEDVTCATTELCALKTVEIGGLKNATDLNGKLAIIRHVGDVSLCKDAGDVKMAAVMADMSDFFEGRTKTFNPPTKILKRRNLVKSSCDAFKFTRSIWDILLLQRENEAKQVDLHLESDPGDDDEVICDLVGSTNDVALECSEGSYRDVTVLTEAEILAKFDDPATKIFSSGGEEFAVFHVDLISQDKRMQKTALQFFAKNKFHAQNLYKTYAGGSLPTRTSEKIIKIMGRQQGERIERGGIVLERDATKDEVARLQGANRLDEEELLQMQTQGKLMNAPPDDGVWLHVDDAGLPWATALDFVDNYHIDYRLVDKDFRKMGLGKRLLKRLQYDVGCVPPTSHVAGTAALAVSPPRPAIVTTWVLKLSRYGEWYRDVLGFHTPKQYGVAQHNGNELFNLLWIPPHVRATYFDTRVSDLHTIFPPSQTRHARQKRCVAKPPALPVIDFGGEEFDLAHDLWKLAKGKTNAEHRTMLHSMEFKKAVRDERNNKTSEVLAARLVAGGIGGA
eukprot:g13366.t1